jgi:L-galactose dehydrogenase
VDTVTLGRTGVRVGIAGLGCGGYSQLGQANGATVEESIRVVHRALALGINFVDTAPAYGTEDIVGRALAGRRDKVIVSTKVAPRRKAVLVSPAELRASVEASLRHLRSEYVDVLHLHGVRPEDYSYCLDALVPEMQRLRDEGRLRFLGITEHFGSDPSHHMLERAVSDPCWDTAMVGFNMLNTSADRVVLPSARAADIGIEVMFAARRALATEANLVAALGRWQEEGLIGAHDAVEVRRLLLTDSGARSVADAAYRFARHQSGAHVVLTGTGDIPHLEDNVRSMHAPALPPATCAALADRLVRLTVTGD